MTGRLVCGMPLAKLLAVTDLVSVYTLSPESFENIVNIGKTIFSEPGDLNFKDIKSS